MFSTNTEGTYFETLVDSWLNVFVMFTLSNYPYIMFPYYAVNRYAFFYFLTYISIGLYIFMNFLLAVIFNNFKALIKEDN